MFGNDPILVHDVLGQVYAFTCWRRPISDNLSERDVFNEDRAYAKQTLRSIASYQQHDPFNYRLYDVWQMVFDKPWTRPATLDQLINDLAEAAHNGRLFAYLESSWLDQAPEASSGPGGGIAESSAGGGQEADAPRTQSRSTGFNEPSQAFLAPIPPVVARPPVTAAPAQLTVMQRAAAGAATFTKVLRHTSPLPLLTYSSGLGGSLEEVVVDDGTTYRKYSSELIYTATGTDGAQWQTASIQDDVAYRTWKANGGEGSYHDWIAEGKPSGLEGISGGGASSAQTIPSENSVSFTRFSGDYDSHITVRDFDVPRKRGIGGAHNADEFFKYSNEYQVIETTPHPSVDGVHKVRYQMSALDRAGNPTGEFRAKVLEKTIYDPGVISDQQMLQWGREAASQAQTAGPLNREWIGTASNGVQFRGYLDDTGAVRSFFPDF